MTRVTLAVLVCVTAVALSPAAASASLSGDACKAAGAESGLAGDACNLARSPGKLVSAGKNLITGHFGSALKDVLGGGSSVASTASTALALAAVVSWAVGGAKFALDETAKVLTRTTRPNLRSTWFSGTYWRMAGIAALLTLPFLFAAAVQALMRSDLSLLIQAALGYLPLAMLAVSIAAPLTMLLLAATDELCGLVSAAGAGGGARFLTGAGTVFGIAHFAGQPFVTFLLAGITAGGALMVWLELAIREAAVYVIVLMLPLAFAALVWPARRVWAIRSVELLVALILSKFAIVAVLGLAGAALGKASSGGLTTALAGTVLVLLAAFSPWALLRLIPLSELAAGAASTLRPELQGAVQHGMSGDRPARETPPDRQPEMAPTAGAEAERDRLREQEAAAVGQQHAINQPLTTPSRPGERAAPSRPDDSAAPTRPDDRVSSSQPGDPTTPAPEDGRPAVLASVNAPENREQPLSDPPEIVLGPSAFEDGRWNGPVFDVLSGEPGEDHDPLPPSQDDGSL